MVKFDKNGDLVLKNIGRRPVYVLGRPVLTGQSTKLEHRQIVEVCVCVGGGGGCMNVYINFMLYVCVLHTI